MAGTQLQITHDLHPALSRPLLTPRIIPSAIHRTDIEQAGPGAVGQSWSSASRSSWDYAARDEFGDPRGRKSGVGWQLVNASFPARAEGEKRLLSATRNPYAAMQSVA